MRIVVVGAGVGGLAVAARLAAGGHEVTVCEQAERVGGKLGLWERDGFRFDTGPSLVTMPHVVAETFAATGGQAPRLEPVEPIAHYRFADGIELDTTADAEALRRGLDAALGAGAGADWARLMGRAERIYHAVRGPFLESPLAGWRTLRRLATTQLGDLATVAPHRSLRGLGRSYLRDPRLRMLLDRYATYTGSDPRRAPAALATVPYVEQAFGAWYAPGGLYRIAEALRACAQAAGAEVRTGADVAHIELAGERVAGVRLAGGERLAAGAVVANVDAAHLYGDLLDGPAAARARRRLARATPSLSGFVMLLGVRGRTPGLAHHTVLFPADYDAEFDAIFGADPRPVGDPTLYIAVPRDPAVAPDGHEAWFVLVNAPRQGQVDWTDALACRYADHLLSLLAARGLDLSGRVCFREVISPADLARRTRAVGGAIYGTSSNGPRAAFLRPPNCGPVPGLYLVGGSSHPGGGLPLVLLSARIVANLLLGQPQ
ncbi:MAG: phytoene desaturase family protein [Egibacteraceae bacterium]